MSKNVTMYSVAEKLGISVSAVSRAFTAGYKMDEGKRRTILDAAAQMGYVRNESASRLSMKPVTIGIVCTDDIPEFYGEICRGLRDAEKQLSDYKLICRYVRVSQHPAPDCRRAVGEALAGFAAEGCDGAVIAAVFADGISEVIRKFASLSFPVALVNYDAEDCGRLFASVNDVRTAARMAASLLRISGSRNVTVITGVKTLWTHIKLVENFLPAAQENGLTVRNIYSASGDDDLAAQLPRIFADETGMTGIYLTSATSVPLCEYVRSHGLSGKVHIVASDIYPRLSRYLRDGTVDAAIYQNPARQAFSALECLYRFCANKIAPPACVTARPEIIVAGNLELFLPDA